MPPAPPVPVKQMEMLKFGNRNMLEGPCEQSTKVQVLLRAICRFTQFIISALRKLKAKPRVIDEFSRIAIHKSMRIEVLRWKTRNCQISAQRSTRWVVSMSFKAKLHRERSLVSFPQRTSTSKNHGFSSQMASRLKTHI